MSAIVATPSVIPTPAVDAAALAAANAAAAAQMQQQLASAPQQQLQQASSSSSSSSSAAAASQPYASASLYVGDLNNDVTEALLFEIFNAVGPVASVRVCRDASTRRSLGYAYVNFHRLEDAERALDTLNFKMIRNRACRIMWSHRDPALRRSGVGNIFVNHLAREIDNKQLYDTFSMFGNILSCKVATNSKRESLGYGFVHYETDESANAAIARVDGKVIMDVKVSVQKFMSKKERPSAAAKNRYTNVFVKNLPMDVTLASLEEMFKPYGTITSATVNIPADRQNDEKARAFGFVNFETSEQAAAAVDAGNNIEVLGKKLFVSRAQKKEERQKELTDRFENLKLERAKKYAGVNLFVKNLADEIDDERLTKEFAVFGQISSATVMKDNATSKSRGFGFVCYTTPEEATKAVTEMNGKMLESKPLYVALAQRKEQRRAQLEAQYAARQKLGGGQGGQGGPMQTGLPLGPQLAYPQIGGMPLMFPHQQMQQMQQQRNFMNAYPQQLMNPAMARWNPQQNAAMMGMVGGAGQPQMRGPGQQLNYQLMPAPGGMNNGGARQNGPVMGGGPNNGMNRGPRTNNNNGPRGPGPAQQQMQQQQQQQMMNNGARGPMQQQQMPMNNGGKQQQQQPLPGQQNIRYNENVRNQAGQQQQQQRPPVQQQQVPVVGPSDTLTPSALANAPEEMRKQMIGERLFPLVRNQEPNLAGKITGMLLEMDNGELLHLLESREALNEKIQEALTVLHQHGPDDEEQQTQQ